jgi:hypothetical protein
MVKSWNHSNFMNQCHRFMNRNWRHHHHYFSP